MILKAQECFSLDSSFPQYLMRWKITCFPLLRGDIFLI